ncbi:MAG TPA: MFS transporter [Acidimicrobiales bacterium]|nr:MFS transporter [Acidimicrobiales bacterium]
MTALRSGPFRSRSFRWVWSGEAISMLGDMSYEVVFAWLVLTVTGSPAALAGVLLATTIPRGLLLLVGGAITDRVSPRLVMLGSHLVRGVAVGPLAALGAAGDLEVWHLYAVGVTAGVAEAFFWPASGSIIPSLVPAQDMPRANALVGVAEQVSRMVGPALGGALMSVASAPVALGFNALTFFVAAGTVLAAPRREAGSSARLSPRTLLREIGSGLAYAGRNVEVRIVLLLVSAATLSYSGLFAVGLPALSRNFDNGSLVLGAMLSAWGLGQLVGSLSAAATGLPRRWGLLIIGMTIAEGVSFAALGVVPHPLLAIVLLTLLGIGVAYSSDVALPTFVQTRTPEAMLGRVNSVIDLPRVTLSPLSIAGIGLLAAVDVRWAFAVASIPLLLTGFGLAASPRARTLTTGPSSDRPHAVEPSVPPRPPSSVQR